MDYDSKFNKIIKNIPEDERLSLIDKFTRFTSSDEVAETDFNSSNNDAEKKMKQASMNDYIDSIYKKSSILNKIIIFFLSLISAKTKEDIILENELKNIKKYINLNYGNIVDFEREKLLPNFIKEFIELYKMIDGIRKVIDLYFNDSIYYYGFLNSLIENSFPEKVVVTLKDILPENVEVKIDYMDKNIFIRERDKRLKKFFVQFDSVFLDKLIAQFNKFEILLRVLNFEYDKILRDFFVFDKNEPLNTNNNCEYNKAEESIMKFYRLLSSVTFNYDEINFVYEMIEYSSRVPAVSKTASQETEVKFKEEELLKIKDIFQRIMAFKENIPFKEIFQYFRKDLLFKVKPVKIKVNFIDIYKEYKKTLVNTMWEQFYDKIRVANLSQMLNSLFRTEYNFDILTYFTVELKNKVDKSSTLKLKNAHSLNFISDFIRNIYKTKIEVIINRILIDGIFKRDTDKSNVSVAYYTLMNYFDKIKEFDQKFEDEKDYGKKISLTLKRILTDSAFKTSLINLVTDINEESSKIVYEANECFTLIHNFLKNLIDVNSSKIVPITNLDRVKIPGHPNSFVAVENSAKYLNQFFQIIPIIQEIY